MAITNDLHLISEWSKAFLFDRKVSGFTPGTVTNYRNKMKRFGLYCDQIHISTIEQITPSTLRNYLELLENDGLTVIGRHGHYAALKKFLRPPLV